MKKWVSFAGGVSLVVGSISFGLSINKFGLTEVLAMIFLLISGMVTGLNSADDQLFRESGSREK